jgi:transcriptional regulator with XRE-family HTH domain
MNGDTVEGQIATVGERIRQRRLELGLSMPEISGEGVSYAYLSRIEANARQPSIKALRKLAPKLGVSPYWLETGEADPAQALARLVIDHPEGSLPSRAQQLARSILKDPR